MRVVNEQVVHRVGVAAGSPQAEHEPDVVDRRLFAAEQGRAFPRLPVRPPHRRPVRFDADAMAAEPCRVPAAAGERPFAGEPPAAFDPHCLAVRAIAPGEHIADAAKRLPRRVEAHIGSGHHTDRALVHAPGGTGVTHGDRLDTLDIGRRLQLRAAAGMRHQQAEHARREHRVQHVRWQLARGIDAGRGLLQQRDQGAGTGDGIVRCIGLPWVLHIHLRFPPARDAPNVTTRRTPGAKRAVRPPRRVARIGEVA